MRTQRVRPLSATDRWARALYRRAFPRQEQMSWPLLHLAAATRPAVDIVAWWDNPGEGEGVGAVGRGPDEPCALTVTVRGRQEDRVLYLFYLAVDDAARGRGVGTRLLDEVARRHPGWMVCLDIEPVIAEAPNADQRRRRLRFYERAGFRDTGYDTIDPTGRYWTLARGSAGSVFSPERLERTWRRFDGGLSRVRLKARS